MEVSARSLVRQIVNCFFQVFVIQDEQAEKHAAELEKALERARAAEKARSLFFSIVSHDIRTPLNAILGYSELLQFGIEDEAERDARLGIRTPASLGADFWYNTTYMVWKGRVYI